MTAPYDDKNDDLRDSADSWGSISGGVQTGAGILFVIVGVASLVAAAIFQERVALMVGIVATLFGLTRLLLPWVQRRGWRR